MPIDIALLGGCTSLRPFRLLKRKRDFRYRLVASYARASLVSLFTPRPDIDIDALTFTHDRERRWFEGEITRTLGMIGREQFDYLLVDFAEETPNLCVIGNGYLNWSTTARASGLRELLPNARIIPRTESKVTELWKSACTRFCRGALSDVPGNKIILHKIQLSSTILRNKAFSQYDEPKRRNNEVLNKILDSYHEHFLSLVPDARVIDLPPELRVCDGDKDKTHPFHYIEEYDLAFIDQLEKLTAC